MWKKWFHIKIVIKRPKKVRIGEKKLNWQEMKSIFEDEIQIAKEKYPDVRQHIADRCIGIFSEDEWEKIRTTHIAVLGTGGIGMPLLELLVRSGAETLTIVDMDVIDPTNMNRVQFAFPFTYGQKKTEVAEIFMRLINPNVTIRKFDTITTQNAVEIFEGVEVAALTLDGLKSSLIASKYCHEYGIPFVEGWALAGVVNARIFTPDGPSYEEVYNLKIDKDYDDISEAEWKQLSDDFFINMTQLSIDIQNNYLSDGIKRMLDGAPRRSISSFVWIESTMLATVVMFNLILKRKLPQKVAPNVFLYDYLRYTDLIKKKQKRTYRKQIAKILNNGHTEREKINAILDLVM